MLSIVSNDSLCEKLISHIRLSTLSHAYIIEGKTGSGKFTIAQNIAAALACREKNEDDSPTPCGKCSACQKIFNGKSPDIIIIEREEKSSISVDQIRKLRNDAAIYPNELDYKAYIIKEADTMTVEAQNALLLTLEEPPAYVIILLLCESVQPLLETIKSRAPVLRTLPIKIDEIDKYLINGCGTNIKASNAARLLKNNSPSEYNELLLASNGCIGNAISLLDGKKRVPMLKSRELVRKIIDCSVCTQSPSEVFDILNELPQKRPELSAYIQLLQSALRDLLLSKKSDYVKLGFYSSQEEASSLSDRFTEKRLCQMYDACEDSLFALKSNANIKLTITELFIKTGLY